MNAIKDYPAFMIDPVGADKVGVLVREREWMQDAIAPDYKGLADLEDADGCCENLITLRAHMLVRHQFGSDIDWHLRLFDDVESTVSLGAMPFVRNLVTAYEQTGDEKYAVHCARILWSFYRGATLPNHRQTQVFPTSSMFTVVRAAKARGVTLPDNFVQLKDEYWILCDLIRGDGEHLLEQLFHIAPCETGDVNEPLRAGMVDVSSQAIVSRDEGLGNLAILPVDCGDLKVRKQMGEMSPAAGWWGILGEFPAWEVTLACERELPARLKPAGYTTGVFGKWHIGDHPETRPPSRGFDESSGLMYSNDMWKHHPQSRNFDKFELQFWKNGEIIIDDVTPEQQRNLTTWYAEHAVDFIERNAEEPFFLYVPHNMPHVPLFCSDKFEGKSGEGLYADVMMEIDWSVGQIMEALEKAGVADNTMVVFTSDMENDAYETTNVIDEHPEVAQKLQAFAEAHRDKWWVERN